MQQMAELHGMLSRPLIAVLEAFLASIMLLPFLSAVMHGLAHRGHAPPEQSFRPPELTARLETLESFPYSLGRLATVLRYEAEASGSEPEWREAGRYNRGQRNGIQVV